MSNDHKKSYTDIYNVIIFLFGSVLVLIGAALSVGGALLIYLGGTFYYLAAGILVFSSGILYFKKNAWAFYVYLAAFVLSVVWSLFEVGPSLWPLIPRLAGPLVLLILAVLLLPVLSPANGRALRRAYGLTTGAAVAAMIVAVAFASGQGPTLAAPEQRPNIAFDDPDNAPAPGEWSAYGAGASAQRFSNLDQITPTNVASLKRVWTYATGDLPDRYGSELTPIKVGGRLYGCTPMNIMFALDPATGKEIWRYDPKVPKAWIPYTAACRGVTYFKDPNATQGAACAERIIEGTLDMRLIAVDATSGRPCPDFGANGSVDLTIGLAQKDTADSPVAKLIPGTTAITSAPVVVQGVIVANHQVLDGQRRWAPSGVIRGYDAVTGEIAFAWDINQPQLTKLPASGQYYSFGTPNSWGPLTGDEKLGLAYIPMGNSAGDYFSSLRSDEENKYSSALVALDVKTGKPRWAFQTVRKDVWDYDLGAQASLVEFPKDGKTVPALLIPTKRGDIFVLDRATGEPLVPIEERPVPQGGAEPEQRAATQPFSTYHTLRKADLTERDMWGLSPIDQMVCRINFRRARYDGPFTPPEVNRHSIEYPGYNGGSDWGGVAVDPRRGVIVANYNDMANYNMLLPRAEADREKLFAIGDKRATTGGSSAEGAGAQEGTPFGILVNAGWQTPAGVLCTRPPYGGIRAIDLATGKTLWDRPYGSARRNGPFGLPTFLPTEIGTPNNGGAAVTAGGLIFIAAATDNLIKAIDIKTGEILWSDVLPAGGQATPMVYEQNGKQYVAVMSGGHHFMMTPGGDKLVAYALP